MQHHTSCKWAKVSNIHNQMIVNVCDPIWSIGLKALGHRHIYAYSICIMYKLKMKSKQHISTVSECARTSANKIVFFGLVVAAFFTQFFNVHYLKIIFFFSLYSIVQLSTMAWYYTLFDVRSFGSLSGCTFYIFVKICIIFESFDSIKPVSYSS